MSDEADSSFDLIGAGKIAKAIPTKAWEQLVATACETFTQCLAPITATTSGLGRLIEAWFNKLSDAQKILAAETVSRATKKIEHTGGKTHTNPKASVIVAVLDGSSIETDRTIRELWANLLAQELLSGNVHPEFVRILTRLTSNDAHTLSFIAKEGDRTLSRTKLNVFLKSLARIGFMEFEEGSVFSVEHLANLCLIARVKGLWNLTATGSAFIQAVSDPSITVEKE